MSGVGYPVYGGNGITGYHSDYLLSERKLIIGRVGVRCGVTHLTKEKSWVTDNALIVNFKLLGFNLRFMQLKLQFENLNKLSNSTAQPVISGSKIYAYEISFPPFPEQRAIVAKIEELFSSLDSGIADLKKAQEQLKIYRQAVLKKAFEGELTKEWRAKQTNLPTAEELLEQIKEERKNHYLNQIADWKKAVKDWDGIGAKPSKPKMVKELFPLVKEELEVLPIEPDTWKWCKVDKIAGHNANSLKAGPFGSSLKKSFYTETGYKIYGQEQVISGNAYFGDYYVGEEKYNSLINCAVFPKDILISLVGTVGKVLVLPDDSEQGIINPRLVKITLNRFYDSIFFKYYFESSFLKSLYKVKNHGTTMDVLNLGSIKELPYPLCSIQEQHQIVQEIESRLSVCDKVEETIVESLEKSKALRQSILKKAFEGKLLNDAEIAACKAALDYEPASVLLERIKAEKTKSIKSKKQ
ncbi:restriction endonuclease subunit S [Lutibacter sp.]|uniref:restriction endonuclease subunit S n=1 Tax=Lutibacter sp. TaxID=1925666 RepID=UPI0035648C38